MIAERLRMARLAAGQSQDELGRAVGVSKMAISKYETGSVVPGSARLVDLAEALGAPVAWLLDPAPAGRVWPIAARAHPLRDRLSSAESAALLARAAVWLERYRAAEIAAGVMPPAGPRLDSFLIAGLDDAESAADRVRESWSLGADAIESVVEALEDHGVPVQLIEGASPVDAYAITSEDGRPAVLVAHQPGDRQRFSLAHELAHLVLAPSDAVDPEKAAHRFAAAFLVPGDTARRELGAHRHALSVDELRSLKRKYGFSMQAWVRRARELGIVSRRTAASQLAGMRAWGWEDAEPLEGVAAEVPARLERLVLRALAEGEVTESRASELLAVPVDSLRTRLRCA